MLQEGISRTYETAASGISKLAAGQYHIVEMTEQKALELRDTLSQMNLDDLVEVLPFPRRANKLLTVVGISGSRA